MLALIQYYNDTEPMDYKTDLYFEIEEKSPERNLIAAIINRTVNDLFEPSQQKKALAWFEYKGIPGDYPGFTFKQCCEMLQVDGKILLAKVYEITDWVKNERNKSVIGKIKIENCPIVYMAQLRQK